MSKFYKRKRSILYMMISVLILVLILSMITQLQLSYAVSENDANLSDLKFTLYTNTENGNQSIKY